jgi:starch synthase
VREISGLKDAVRDFGCEEGGNGYTFKNYNAHDMLYSIRRGVTDFVNDGPAWENKVRICMGKDFSWKTSVKKYLELYRKLKKGE